MGEEWSASFSPRILGEIEALAGVRLTRLSPVESLSLTSLSVSAMAAVAAEWFAALRVQKPTMAEILAGTMISGGALVELTSPTIEMLVAQTVAPKEWLLTIPGSNAGPSEWIGTLPFPVSASRGLPVEWLEAF